MIINSSNKKDFFFITEMMTHPTYMSKCFFMNFYVGDRHDSRLSYGKAHKIGLVMVLLRLSDDALASLVLWF